MNTIELILTAKKLIGVHPDWFDQVCRWYQNTHLTRQIIEESMRSAVATVEVAVAINGRFLANLPASHNAGASELKWELPANLLFAGDNNINVQLDPTAKACLRIGYASAVWHEKMPGQWVDLSQPNPEAAQRLALALRNSARQHTDHCEIRPGGSLLFRLHLEERHPVQFAIGCKNGHAFPHRQLLDEVMDEVLDAVIEKQQELQARRDRRQSNSKRLANDLRALQAYESLHVEHLEPAIRTEPPMTLADAIAETRSPAKIIQSMAPPAALATTASSGFGVVFWFLVVLLLIGGVVFMSAWGSGYIDPTMLWTGAKNAPRNKQNGQPQIADGGPNDINRILRQQGAKTGDVQISLYWKNKNDLDLHVICPSGERIFWNHRRSRCGGELDVDMNAAAARAKNQAAENVHWPKGRAPRGKYVIKVRHFSKRNLPGCADPTRFTVRVVVHGRERSFQGQVAAGNARQREMQVHEFTLN